MTNKRQPKKKFKRANRQFDKSYKGVFDSKQGGKSETIPDMSLSIPQLLQHHTRGILPDIHQPEPQYFDSEIPQILDITDLESYKQTLVDEQARIEKDIEAQKLALEHAKKQEVIPTPTTNEKTPPAES